MKVNRLDVKSLGLAFGVAFGLYAFFMGMMGWQFGLGIEIVDLVSKWYVGYGPSFKGSLIGGVWGFIDGFIGGVIIAFLYNLFQRKN